jgi:hypothetical protein
MFNTIWRWMTSWLRPDRPGVVVIEVPLLLDQDSITDWFRDTTSCPDCEGRMFYQVLNNPGGGTVMICGTCTSEFNFRPGRVTRVSPPRRGRTYHNNTRHFYGDA